MERILHSNCRRRRCCRLYAKKKRAFGFLLCDLKESPPCLLHTALTNCVLVSKLTAENKHNRTESVPVAEHTGTDNRLKHWLGSIKTANFYFFLSDSFQQSHRLCTKPLQVKVLLDMGRYVNKLLWLGCQGWATSLWLSLNQQIQNKKNEWMQM